MGRWKPVARGEKMRGTVSMRLRENDPGSRRQNVRCSRPGGWQSAGIKPDSPQEIESAGGCSTAEHYHRHRGRTRFTHGAGVAR